MSTILRGSDNLDSSNVASDTELSAVNTWVANDSRAKTALNATGTAPIYACRAWVNFNGTGTVAIRGSGNVSSITDNGVGNYTVNCIAAMQDSNSSPTVCGSQSFGAIASSDTTQIYDITTSTVKIACFGNPDTPTTTTDFEIVTMILTR